MKKICMILVLCLMATFAYGQAANDSDSILIIATGHDIDQPGITAFIKAQIEFVPTSIGWLPSSVQVNFRANFQDAVTADEGYIIEGELENAMVMKMPYFWCPIREWFWRDMWFVMGMGLVKTTDAVDTEFDYRGEIITLPHTFGEYEARPILMLVSSDGKWSNTETGPIEGYFGGWALAGPITKFDADGTPTKFVGGIAWLRNYLDKRVP